VIDMLKRHAIQVLRQAGHDQADVGRLVGSAHGPSSAASTVNRTSTHTENVMERACRAIGRPAKAEPFRSVIAEIFPGEPDLLSVEILRRAKCKGYADAKTALLRADCGRATKDRPSCSHLGQTVWIDAPEFLSSQVSISEVERRCTLRMALPTTNSEITIMKWVEAHPTAPTRATSHHKEDR
jgi:hypothetical protein